MPQQPISNVKALAALHFSLLIGQVIFAVIATYLMYSKSFYPVVTGEDLQIMVGSGIIGFSVALVIAAFAMFKKKVEKIRLNADDVPGKLSAYRAASIIRWAMLEAPVILTVISFLLTGRYSLLIVAALLLLIFFYTKPSSFKVAQDLSIGEEEVK